MTGLTFQLGALKLYQMLTEAAPTVTRGVYLYDPESAPPGVPGGLRSQAQAVNVEWQSVALRDDPNGVAQAFAQIGRGANGLVLDQATRLQLKAARICALALQRRVPAVGFTRAFPDAGCLMSYSENIGDMHRRAAGLVVKILKGAKPADLPVEQPTKFELVINLQTAKALGRRSRTTLLLRADQSHPVERVLDQRGRLLRAALGFAGLPSPSYDRSLWALRTWLDSWSGIGRVAVGMHRQGYDLQLTRYDERGWRATFLTTGMEHSPTTATGIGMGARTGMRTLLHRNHQCRYGFTGTTSTRFSPVLKRT